MHKYSSQCDNAFSQKDNLNAVLMQGVWLICDIRHLERSIPVIRSFKCRSNVRFVVDSDEYMVDNMSLFYANQQAP